MKHSPALLLWWLCLHALTVSSQNNNFDYGFTRTPNIMVLQHGDTLPQPWVGGMNAVYFSSIDLNMDGVDDLVAFEKHGNRILPFLRQGDKYLYAPQFTHLFPYLHDWAIFKDYNGDGKQDIFTYGLAGVRVFLNDSEETLSFRLITDQLPAYYYNGYINLYASPDDYLVVDDIDGDGRTDILNFWVLGKFVHFLRNHTTDPDLFDMQLESSCWGHFAEAEDSNTITLFTDCDNKGDDDQLRHTGSSMLWIDIDHDGVHDLLLGDVDSPHLIFLRNGGSDSDAFMVSQETAFPANAPVVLYSMPAASAVLLPNQNLPSLLIAPSDPSLSKSQDINCVWRYDYDTQLQQYVLIEQDFLQKEMLDMGSGCHPVLYDWDHDGLIDLFLSNYGQFDSARFESGFLHSFFSSSIRYYHNIGNTTQPVFRLEDDDFGHLRAEGFRALHPAFGDVDGDGLTDMLCGNEDGTLLCVPNSRITTGEGLIIPNYKEINVEGYSTPQLFDLDMDGRADLLIGNRRGLLCYYRNIGTCGIMDFEWITDSLGQVDVRDHSQSYFGHSVPCFFRDSTHGTTLLCGSEQGAIFYYTHIDGHLYDTFTLAESSLAETVDGTPLRMREGLRSAPAIAHMDDDGRPDLVVGNYAGGVSYYSGSEGLPHGTHTNTPIQCSARVFPNPTTGLLHCLPTNPQEPIRTLELFDIYGNRLMLSNHNLIDLSPLASGIYVLLINHNERIKIIKH